MIISEIDEFNNTIYKNGMSDIQLEFLAKSSCRKCNGKGKLNFDDRVEACGCVVRNLNGGPNGR